MYFIDYCIYIAIHSESDSGVYKVKICRIYDHPELEILSCGESKLD